ncbi:hypothetical protein CLOM_g19364 [Closterium sp. NIES-68]|nr:hypothetical protein CLOM_g19364 [Closterium sp. NIES-68]GJP76862.1 hypothetical protein CLOP_g7312 [Closterium sp. NIES-67]
MGEADASDGAPTDVELGEAVSIEVPPDDAQRPENPHQPRSLFEAAASAPGTRFHPVSLAFKGVTYTVTLGRGKAKTQKLILDNLTGYVKAGTFLAIMGPSGCGKTSLLNVLAGRVMRTGAPTSLAGQMLVNGRPRDKSFRRISAYVMQDDLMFSTLTVWETLQTAAMLRLPSSTPKARKLQLAESIITELGLTNARNTPIGNERIRGVSGGERKRTNIAVEMLSDPSLVFLDEPTSGLDSFQALNVMSALSDLSKSGRTVVSTIHQPRSSIFALFENLLLLSEGRAVFFGPAAEAMGYFSHCGFACPEHFNPADFYLDVISVDHRDKEREMTSTARIQQLADAFTPSPEVSMEQHQQRIAEQAAEAGGEKYSKYASSWVTQFAVLARRSWRQVTRDRIPIGVAYIQAVFMMAVVSILFSNSSDSPQQNMTGSLFIVSLFLALNGLLQMITTFPLEKGVINRERASNSYRISAYYPAKVLSEWPIRIGPVIIFAVIVYWPVEFQQVASKFFLFLLICLLEFTAMNGLGILIGSLAPTPELALALAPLFMVVLILFGGLLVNLDSIPVWIRWVRYISPIQWGFVGLSVNQLAGLTFTCPPGSVTCPTGDAMLKQLSIDNFTVGASIGYQCCLILGMHLLACTALVLNGPKMQPLASLEGVPEPESVGPGIRDEGSESEALGPGMHKIEFANDDAGKCGGMH